MKTRIGFVSNSSTTSFSIYGCAIENGKSGDATDKIFQYLTTKPGFDKIFEKKMGAAYTDGDGCDRYTRVQMFKELCDGMQIIYGQYDEMYIGKSFEVAKDTETVGEFKQNIAKIIKNIFGEDMVCDFYTKGWYDG